MKEKGIFLLLACFAFLLAACGGAADDTAVAPSVTVPPPPVPEADSNVRLFLVVPEQSEATYIVDEEFFAEALSKLGIPAGRTVVVGRTEGVSGFIQLNSDNPDWVETAQFTVDMTGLATDQQPRDEWLEDNALQTSLFPQATFTATAVSGLPESYNEGEEVSFDLTGDLTVRDVTRSVTFGVTAVLQNGTLEGTATLPTRLTDFGIQPPDFANTLTVADEFTIEVNLVARQHP